MEILVLLIPLSVVLALLIGAGFWWSVANGQFDDLASPAHRILADDDRPRPDDELPHPDDGAQAAEQKMAPGALTPINPAETGRR